MAMRLPEPMLPLWEPPVASAMISIKVLAPSFMLASGVPVMLPERSKTRTMSVGLATMSGAAVRARVTFREPSQSIRSVLMTLFEFVTPIGLPPSGLCPYSVCRAGGGGTWLAAAVPGNAETVSAGKRGFFKSTVIFCQICLYKQICLQYNNKAFGSWIAVARGRKVNMGL